MNKSYRNTVEIAEYANNIAKVSDIEIFERHGKPVEEKNWETLETALQKVVENLNLGEEAYETASVICRTEEEAYEAYRYLKEKLAENGFDVEKKLSYMDRNSSNFKKGLTVTTFYLAKGLEFDQVFSLFPKKAVSSLEQQARYIAATRALHELYMYEYE